MRLSPIALVLVVVATAGCGQATAARHAKRAVAASQSTVQTQSAADQLYTDITGTAIQRGAGDKLAYHIEEDPLTQCMTGSGIDYYSPMPFIDEWKDWPSGGASTSDTGFLAPLNDAGYWAQVEQAQAATENARAAEEITSNHAYTGLTDSQRKAWDAAMGSCNEGAGYEEAWHPDQYYTLDYAYHAVIYDVDSDTAARFGDAYTGCMASAGYDAIGSHQDLVAMLEGKLPPVEQIPDPGDQGGDAWQAWLTLERSAIAADGVCRADAYASGLAELGPQIQQFRSDHADELIQEAAGWDKITGGA